MQVIGIISLVIHAFWQSCVGTCKMLSGVTLQWTNSPFQGGVSSKLPPFVYDAIETVISN